MGKRPTLPRLQRVAPYCRQAPPPLSSLRTFPPLPPVPACRCRASLAALTSALAVAVPLVITSAALCPALPCPAVPMPSAWPACRRAYVGSDVGPCRPVPPARGRGRDCRRPIPSARRTLRGACRRLRSVRRRGFPCLKVRSNFLTN